MEYSPFNIFIWLIVVGVIVIFYLTVRIYHGKYPNYPNEEPDDGK